MNDDRICDPRVAERLAYREDWSRDRSIYWFAYTLGQAAVGHPHYVKMLRHFAPIIQELFGSATTET